MNRQLNLLAAAPAAPAAPAARRSRQRGGLEPTAALARERRCGLILSQVRYVRRFFPELATQRLRVGLTRRAAGLAELEGRTLWLNPRRLALHTIAHELTHLLQGRGLVPGGERSCDLFAVARDPSLVDILPCYLDLPAGLADRRGWLRPGIGLLLHRVARRAVQRRGAGLRRYIRWFETEVAALAALPPARARSRLPGARGPTPPLAPGDAALLALD